MSKINNQRKIVVLLGDGMADLPIESLGGRTPLEAAKTPNMDRIASMGICGTAQTVPTGMDPGSDTANLSVFGYDPRVCYTGRAPLEAINMDIPMGPGDAAFRCNIVRTGGGIMESFTSDHIESAFSAIIMNELSKNINIKGIEFYAGVSYRNIMIWRDYPHADITSATPPHDISGRGVADYLPKGSGSDILNRIMNESKKIIAESSAVAEARARLKGNPESAWIWGGGRRPSMNTLAETRGLHGYTISAVDLIHGIGKAAGLKPLKVEGATGYIDTDYEGKVAALIDGIDRSNFVFLHVEAPDESGHAGRLDHKLQSIEDFDARVVGPVMKAMERYPEYSVLVMPDHPTPVALKTHTSDHVPFCAYRSPGWEDASLADKKSAGYSEPAAAATGLHVEKGHQLLDLMISGKF
jgi:2,3-bisphosphoglycerate-independent phosphoglycerate mutase